MRYKAVDELPNFDYHDAYIDRIEFKSGRMLWEVRDINALESCSQNNFEYPVCIGSAVMTFEKTRIEKIFIGGYQTYDSNNILIDSVEDVIVPREQYADILKKAVTVRDDNEWYSYSTEIFGLVSFRVLKGGRYEAVFDIMFSEGDSPSIMLTFDRSVIEWDDFSGKAWFVLDDEKEFKKKRQEWEKSWAEFIAGGYNVGDVVEVTLTQQAYGEILPNVIGFIENMPAAEVNDGASVKVKISDIQKELKFFKLEWIQK